MRSKIKNKNNNLGKQNKCVKRDLPPQKHSNFQFT